MEQPTRERGTRHVVQMGWIAGLDQADSWRTLRQEPVGRIGYLDYGYPQVVPVNHAIDDHSIVFRTASLLSRVATPMPVSFEVDAYDRRAATGWSVIVHGVLQRVTADEEIRACERTGLNAWAPGERDRWYRIVPARVTGRVIGRRRIAADGTALPYTPSP